MYNPRRDDLDIQKYVQVEQVLKTLKSTREERANNSARAKFAAWDSQSSPPPARSPKNKIEDARNKFESWLNSSSPPPRVSPSPKKKLERMQPNENDDDASMFFFVPLTEERTVERPPKLVSRRSYIAPPPGALRRRATPPSNLDTVRASNTTIKDANRISGNVTCENYDRNVEQAQTKKRKKLKGEAKWDRLMRGIPSKVNGNTHKSDESAESRRTRKFSVPKLIIMPLFK